MIERIELGSSPYGEDCAQVGKDSCDAMIAECRAYINQLYRMLESKGYKRDELPEGFCILTNCHAHDFGTYYEVVCRYNGRDELSCDIAYWLDSNCPEHWDSAALRELNR